MTVSEARLRLAQPLKFGDPKQIAAVRMIENLEEAMGLLKLIGIIPCADCEGTGKADCISCAGDGDHKCDCGDWHECLQCEGTGKEECLTCNGAGNADPDYDDLVLRLDELREEAKREGLVA